MEKLKIIEAILFGTGRVLYKDEICKVLGISNIDLEDALKELKGIYRDRPIEIVEDTNFVCIQIRREYTGYVKRFKPDVDIPKGPLKTLALIAYKQPIKQSEVIKIRGNQAYKHITFLKERGLITAEKYRNTKLLKTTPLFEKYFGDYRSFLSA